MVGVQSLTFPDARAGRWRIVPLALVAIALVVVILLCVGEVSALLKTSNDVPSLPTSTSLPLVEASASVSVSASSASSVVASCVDVRHGNDGCG